MPKPEAAARIHIDAMLAAAGWVVQDYAARNLYAAQGVAIREFPLQTGTADYLLFVDQKAVGALEAKPVGFTLTGVEPQADKYAHGLPTSLTAPVRPLPFLYLSTGAKTRFVNLLDPKPLSRDVFAIHQPATLAEWLQADTLDGWVKALHLDGSGVYTSAAGGKPSTLRGRLQTMPNLEGGGLRPNQVEAIAALEKSLRDNRPRALVQMATGSGKTLMAVTELYRLIKFAGARRVLFLVDRTNLGEQAEKEFHGWRTPDDHRKFEELYKVQLLKSATVGASTKVVITTVQRMYAMLRGLPLPDETTEDDAASPYAHDDDNAATPVDVAYNPALPPEFFDVIVVDECHRSIYTLWRQVLEYFDAFLIGLTATPAKHTFGFFQQNLVMSYSHERAVADRVNVDFEVYQIRTKITEHGSTIDKASPVDVREQGSTKLRWLQEDLTYTAKDLDRSVVALDQIRLIAKTLRDKLKTELFPDRSEVPKMLVFAKDDQHADDVVELFRQEFAEGNQFCQKITYKTTGEKPAALIQSFRTSYWPRVAVTVDMVATGTDIRAVEVVVFLREVKSRVLFEQMKGRGVRVIDPSELQGVTPSAKAKTHFVVVDCVGVTEGELADTQPLERKKTTSFVALLDHVASGGSDPAVLSSLASRLTRLDHQLTPAERSQIEQLAGMPLAQLTSQLIASVDPDAHEAHARETLQLPAEVEPTPAQLADAAQALRQAAAKPLAANPQLRALLLAVKAAHEQILDTVSQDELQADKTGFSQAAKDKALQTAAAFETWLQEHKQELDALQFFYGVPQRDKLRFADLKALAAAI